MTNLDLLMIMKLFKQHTNEIIKATSLISMGKPEQGVTGLATYRKEVSFDIKELKLQLKVAGVKELDFTELTNAIDIADTGEST